MSASQQEYSDTGHTEFSDSTDWPTEFHDKYIFSDYCFGIVQVMDPATGILTDTLIEDADFISNLWVGEDGGFYYLRF